MIPDARKMQAFLRLSAQKIWHEQLTEGLSTTEQEAAVYTAKMHFSTSPPRKRPLQSHSAVTTVWSHLQDYSLHRDQRDTKISNAVCSWWWPVSFNFTNLLLSPTTTLLFNIYFVLFEDGELVLQKRRLTTRSAQTHMQNQEFTKI